MDAATTGDRIHTYVHAGAWEPNLQVPVPESRVLHRRIRPPRHAVLVALLALTIVLLVLTGDTLYSAARATCTAGAAPGTTCSEVLYMWGTPP